MKMCNIFFPDSAMSSRRHRFLLENIDGNMFQEKIAFFGIDASNYKSSVLEKFKIRISYHKNVLNIDKATVGLPPKKLRIMEYIRSLMF